MSAEIESRFLAHLDRVRGLVSIYGELVGRRQGRASVRESDLLRAAVVLLHACLEDLIRELVTERLPRMGPDRFADIPFVDPRGKPQERMTLKDLAVLRGRSVDDVVRQSIAAFLDRSSYNHPGDIERALERIGLPIGIARPQRNQLATLMARRHWIAHRLDHNPDAGAGEHAARSLSRRTVEDWIATVERLGRDILAMAGTR